MTTHDGPLDPFLDDPDDPAGLLDDAEPAEPLSEDERTAVLGDLEELTEFRRALESCGVNGISVECGDRPAVRSTVVTAPTT